MILLGEAGLLKHVKLCLQISDLGSALPFQWNQTKNQLEVKHKKNLYRLGLRLGIGTAYMVAEIIQASIVLRDASHMAITHFIMYHITGYLILSCEFLNLINNFGVVQLFNGFIQVEQNFKKYLNSEILNHGQDIQTHWCIRGIIYFLTFTGIFYAFFYAGDILRNPCFPSYAGYWMNTQCIDGKPGYYLEPKWTMEEIGIKLGLSLTSYFIWAPLTAGMLYLWSLEYVIEGNCFRVYTEEFGKILMNAKLARTGELEELGLFYRQLQILSMHYRLNFSQFQIGIAVPCLIAVQTACLNNTFSLISGKDLGGPIWYNLMYVWAEVVFCLVVIFVFGIFAEIYDVSKKIQSKVKRTPVLRRNKWFRRWILSCPTLKIYFGGSNFVDRLTPLTIQDFTINQTVNLMLLQN